MNRSLLLGALALALPLAGCEAVDPTPETAQLSLMVDGLVGTTAYAPGTTYTVNGRATTFADARMYISNVRLVRGDGSTYAIAPESPLTLPAYDDAGTEVSYTVNQTVDYVPLDLGPYEGTLGEVPAGTYTGVTFDVGLAGRLNHVNPLMAPAGHALAKRTGAENNHWSWNMGYIFSRTEGRVDLNGDGDVTDAEDADWMVHLGTDGYTATVELDEPFTVEGGSTPGLHLQVDLGRLLQNVDLSVEGQRMCMTMGCAPVATAYRDMVPTAFRFHGLHED